ncbi:ABC transporter substrate binding protein [Desulfoluna sp.]|uniref:ABC transporter substrate-binding protein n=1 Tax=Desulfoluna sp. TaxID=2045199 RepID=UPI0026296CA4|nr:ABC transporter substrate binding protein [Desulfoluna sp.]
MITKLRFYALMTLLFLTIGTPASADSKRVLILQSYHAEYTWVKDVTQGIREALEEERFMEGVNLSLTTFYMDTKRHTETDWKQKKGQEALALINTLKPDVIIASDDNALHHVVSHLKDTAWPIVFTGVNGDPTENGMIDTLLAPGHNISGCLERERFKGSICLLKRVVPGASRIAVISDKGPTSLPILERIKQQADQNGVTIAGIKAATTFEEWQQFVLKMQNQADALVVITYHVVKNDKGDKVAPEDVLRWTVENNRLPEVGFWKWAVEDGLLLSEAISGFQQGYHAGTLAAFILEGQAPAEFAVTTPRRGERCINLSRATSLGLTIPAELQSFTTLFTTQRVLK